MPTIDSYTVTGWQGRLRPSMQRITLLDSMPGVDGSVATLGSWRAEATQIITRVDVATFSAVVSTVNAYRRLGGTSVYVVDQFGSGWASVFQAMTPDSDYDMLINGKYRITTRWLMVTQSVDPTT